MFTNRLFNLFIVAVFVVVVSITACAPQVAVTPEAISAPVATLAQDKPITLRLGIPDGDSVLYAPYVLEFVEQVKTLSNENITIEPVWQAGNSTDAKYEKGVIQLVRDGNAELGLAASRAWDPEVFPNLQVLQAPFLITDDALAEAVATSDIATRMLDSLSSGGVVGLTLWPEDLRHPFSVDPAKPILSPEDFAGLDVRTTDTGVSDMLIKALGGNPIFEASDYQGAESGLRQGATLTGRPAATGNVTFFPKYQVLFVNGAAFEAISEGQRSILRQAAAAAQTKAIAERPGEVNAGSSWCADGGTIVLASEEQVAAFETAAQPVYNAIAQDPSNAELIAAIRELKASTQPAPSAQACAPEVVQASPAPTAERVVWSQGLLPKGVWQAELSASDIFAVGGVLLSTAQADAGVHTFTFKDGKFAWSLKGDDPGYCEGTYALVGDIVRLTFTKGCSPEVDDIQWRLDDEGLHLHLVAIENAAFTEIKAMLEAKPYQKIEEWSEGLPPNGVWQVELSVDDFVQRGVLRSVAESDWAGTYTWTLNDGKLLGEFHGLHGFYGKCQANYEVVGDVVRFTYYTDSDECLGELDDLQWRLDDEGLHFHVVDIKNAPIAGVTAVWEAEPWQKIADP